MLEKFMDLGLPVTCLVCRTTTRWKWWHRQAVWVCPGVEGERCFCYVPVEALHDGDYDGGRVMCAHKSEAGGHQLESSVDVVKGCRGPSWTTSSA